MVLTFENLYQIVSLSLAFLFSFYLLFNKAKGYKSNIYIGLFIFYMGLESLEVLLNQASFYSSNPNLYLIIPNLGFLIYPIFFFYIKSIAFKGHQLTKKDFIHALPYLFILVLSLFQYYSQPLEVKKQIMTDPELKPWFITVFYYALRIQAFIYLYLSIKVAYRFKKIVSENYSTINKRNYKWILQLTYVFLYFVIIALVSNILRFGIGGHWDKKLFYVLIPINIAFFIWIIYKAMSQPYLFNGVDANIKLLKEYLKEKELLEKNNQATKNLANEDPIKLKIENYMETQEAYLNPSLTLFELADGLNMPSIELSLFLNKSLNKNFFDFVNEYRIKKAMEILKETSKKEYTILEILYEVGFNSKSSFNTAFKKYTNLTPTKYRLNNSK